MEDDIVLDILDSPSGSGVERTHSTLKLSSGSARRSTSKKRVKRNWRTDVDPEFPCFDTLPDELVIKIHTFFDPPTLGRTAQCCKRFNMLSSDVPLWRDMSVGQGDWSHKRNPLTQSVTKSYYVAKFLSFRRQTKIREQMEQEEKRRRRREKSIEGSACAMMALFFARPYEWLCTVAVLLFTIFVVLRLDERINWHWAIVFIPMLLVIYQIFLAPLLYEILRISFTYDFDEELAPEKTLRPIFFFLFFLMPLQSGIPLNRFLVFTPIVSWTTFFVLLLANLADAGLWWAAVFAPLFVFGLYLVLLPLVVREFVAMDSKWLDRVIISVLCIFLLVFLTFMVLKLDHVVDWSWYQVMVPLFVLKGFMICVPTMLSIFSSFCCDNWMERRSRWPSDMGGYCIVAAAVIVLLLGPLLAFELLLAQRLEGSAMTSYAIIFIPVFLLEGFGVCGCCALNIVVLFE